MYPDIVVVLDPSLDPAVFLHGLKRDGFLVINTSRTAEEISSSLGLSRVVAVDATRIALSRIGSPIVNIAMLGALARILGIVSLEALARASLKVLFGVEAKGPIESMLESGSLSRIARSNIEAMLEAYRGAEVRGA